MTITLQDFALVAVPVVCGLTWLLRLEGRIDVTDARYAEILNRLDRIERNQDAAKQRA
jgi:hypothetical protein